LVWALAGAPLAIGQQAAEPALYPLAERSPAPLTPKTGYVDLAGRLVIPFRFDLAADFVEGRALVSLAGKYGFIDTQGRLVVAAKYDYARNFSDGRAVVRAGALWGFIDRDGQEIVPPQYEVARAFRNGLAIVGKPPTTKFGPVGAIDVDGRVVVDFVHPNLDDFTDGRALVRRDGKYGFISATGELVIPAIYDHALPFTDGLATVGVRSAGRSRFLRGKIDVDGKVVIPLAYARLGDFKDGRAAAVDAETPNLFHYIDRTGARVSPDMPLDKYCDAGFPPDPSAPLRSPAGKCMYADDEGRNRFGRDFDKASPFVDGLAVVSVSAEEGFGPLARTVKKLYAGVIDTTGAFVVPPVFQHASVARAGVIQVSFGNLEGRRVDYVDRQGKPLTFTTGELNTFIAEMHDALNLAGDVPGRTITAQAAGVDYRFYLPRALCALDEADPADSRIFVEVKEQQAGAQEAARKALAEKNASGKIDPPTPPSVSGLFAPCDQLRAFHATGQRDRLRRIGIATGLRKGPPDPSAGSGIVFIARLVCGSMRGIGKSGLKLENSEQRTERIAQAWAQVAAGQPANLPSIDNYLTGCTSALLSPGEGASVTAATVTTGIVPDWSFDIRNKTTPRGQNDLIEALGQEATLFDAIVELNLRARIP
jgi:hypothetical protein